MIHSVGEKPVFQCELCPTTCGRKTDLRIHVQKLHTSDVPIRCKRCDNDFPDRYSYKMHAKTHEGEKCYRCELCAYASISARHLESHMLIHSDEKPFQCQFCDQTFRQKQLLRRHENIYHNPDYVATTPREKTHNCPTCNKAFRHKGNLMRHMAQHDLSGEDVETMHVKGEPDDMMEGSYVVVEVLNDGTEEQYEDEGSDLELEEGDMQEGMETIVEEVDNYTLPDDSKLPKKWFL
jgi:transcriptional repressor CTCF